MDVDRFGFFSYYLSDGCPADKDYSLVDGSCIRLVQTTAFGDAAQNQCRQDGGHLYYFKDDSNDKKTIEKLLINRSFCE